MRTDGTERGMSARRLEALAQCLLARLLFGREDLVREVGGLEDLAHLALPVAANLEEAMRPADSLFQRIALDRGVAGDQLLGLGERPVDDRALAVLLRDPRSLRARLQA